jgi:hypothetical protein
MKLKPKHPKIPRKHVLEAIESEPELPGEMPDAVWNMLVANKEDATQILRAIVRTTKQNIKSRLGL